MKFFFPRNMKIFLIWFLHCLVFSPCSFGQAFRLDSYVKAEQDAGSPVNSVELTLKPVDLPDDMDLSIKALCSAFHPFFTREKGWASLDPIVSRDVCNVMCHPLRVGDTLLSPAGGERSWDTSGANILAEWAARVSFSSHFFRPFWAINLHFTATFFTDFFIFSQRYQKTNMIWSCFQSIDWLIDWFVDWLPLIDSLIDWLIDWLIDALTDSFGGWLMRWLIDWLPVWLVRGLIDWLIDSVFLFLSLESACVIDGVGRRWTLVAANRAGPLTSNSTSRGQDESEEGKEGEKGRQGQASDECLHVVCSAVPRHVYTAVSWPRQSVCAVLPTQNFKKFCTHCIQILSKIYSGKIDMHAFITCTHSVDLSLDWLID